MPTTGPHTGFPFNRWATSLHNRYRPEARLSIWQPENDQILLAAIHVRRASRGQGLAHMILTEITTTADQYGCTVACSPTPEWGAQIGRLTRWYEQFGFVSNTGKQHRSDIEQSMYRLPGTTRAVQPHEQGQFRLIQVGDVELEVPHEVRHAWLDPWAARLLMTLTSVFGLTLSVDWWHRTLRGTVRLLVHTPDGRPCGSVLISAATGQVRRGNLRLPGRTVDRAEFDSGAHWWRVLAEHAEFLRLNASGSPSRPAGGQES